MKLKTIYLAGAINGQSDQTAIEWRERVKHELAGLYAFKDPMDRDYRGKEDENVEAIVEGDKEDIYASDIVLVHAHFPGWGTGMEVFYAFDRGRRVITICPTRVSPWLRYHSERVFVSLEEAIAFLAGKPDQPIPPVRHPLPVLIP